MSLKRMHPDAPDEQRQGGTNKFGWCLTGHHDKCPGTTVSGLECSCEHHTERNRDDRKDKRT